MTKKDYVKIAAVFEEALSSVSDDFDGTAVVIRLATDMAVMLQMDNPKFDPFKFLIACGVPGYNPDLNSEYLNPDGAIPADELPQKFPEPRVEIRKGVILGRGKAPTRPPPPVPTRREDA